MNKINWKQKLSSRKFWAAVVGFVTAIRQWLNSDAELAAAQNDAIIELAEIATSPFDGEESEV